jgi:hypothetical protein
MGRRRQTPPVPEQPAPATGLRQQWRGIDLEKKLSIIVIPVTLAVAGFLAQRFLMGDSTPPRKESLQIVGDPVVLNDTTKERGYGQTAQVEVRLRNTGTVGAYLHKAQFRVARFVPSEICAPPQGEVAVSARYPVVLPGNPTAGQLVERPINQEVKAGDPDRFAFDMLVDIESSRHARSAAPVGAPGLYLLDISVYHDDSEEPVPAGQALVAIPFPRTEQFVYHDGLIAAGLLVDPECPERNLRRLRSMLQTTGIRSPELERLASDPRGSVAIPSQIPVPTAADRHEAGQAAVELAFALAQGNTKEACRQMDSGALARYSEGFDVECPQLMRRVLDSLGNQVAANLDLERAERGWFRFSNPASEARDGHRIVVIVERAPNFAPAAGQGGRLWVVTNVYDAAEGPIPLLYRD